MLISTQNSQKFPKIRQSTQPAPCIHACTCMHMHAWLIIPWLRKREGNQREGRLGMISVITWLHVAALYVVLAQDSRMCVPITTYTLHVVQCTYIYTICAQLVHVYTNPLSTFPLLMQLPVCQSKTVITKNWECVTLTSKCLQIKADPFHGICLMDSDTHSHSLTLSLSLSLSLSLPTYLPPFLSLSLPPSLPPSLSLSLSLSLPPFLSLSLPPSLPLSLSPFLPSHLSSSLPYSLSFDPLTFSFYAFPMLSITPSMDLLYPYVTTSTIIL